MSLLLSQRRLVSGSPVAIAKFFPGSATLPINSPVPISAALPPRLTTISGGGIRTLAPTSTSIIKGGVSGSFGSFIGGLVPTITAIGSAAGAIGNLFGGGGVAAPPKGPGQTGATTSGPGIATGSGISATGTAGGSCTTIFGQQFCLGGSAGSGSAFSAGGGTGASLPGGSTAIGAGSSAAAAAAGGAVCTLRGHHLNRRGYYTHGGFVAPNSKCVRNRRRNPLNPRALSKALHRLVGFQHASKKIEKHLNRLASGHRRAPMRRLAPGRKASCSCK